MDHAPRERDMHQTLLGSVLVTRLRPSISLGEKCTRYCTNQHPYVHKACDLLKGKGPNYPSRRASDPAQYCIVVEKCSFLPGSASRLASQISDAL